MQTSGSSTEEWRKADGLDHYEVSNLGGLRRTETGHLVKQIKDRGGYMRAHISENGRAFNVLIHRVVAATFVKKDEGKDCVNHINNIRHDNRANNLEWVTPKENSEWMVKCGRQSRLGNPRRRAVIGTNITTGETRIFRSSNATKADGFNQANVWKCCNGRMKQTHGFSFKYAEAAE